MTKQIDAATVLLGGDEVLSQRVASLQDLDGLAQRGLPAVSVDLLAVRFGEDFMNRVLPGGASAWLDTSGRILPEKSHHLVQVALLLAYASEVLGSSRVVESWFEARIRSLGGRRPLDLLAEGNIKEIDDVLTRIEHGVFS